MDPSRRAWKPALAFADTFASISGETAFTASEGLNDENQKGNS
jgi:hypothetical protein